MTETNEIRNVESMTFSLAEKKALYGLLRDHYDKEANAMQTRNEFNSLALARFNAT